MKKAILIITPVVLLIATIVTSILAFNLSNQLDEGYIYVDNTNKTPAYTGEYSVILGNLEESAHFVKLDTDSDGININIYNIDKDLLKSYELIIKRPLGGFSSTILSEPVETNYQEIGNLEDYVIKIDIEKDIEYIFNLTEIENNTEDQELDLVFFYIPGEIYNQKELYESISFTTMIFLVIYIGTIVLARFAKR